MPFVESAPDDDNDCTKLPLLVWKTFMCKMSGFFSNWLVQKSVIPFDNSPLLRDTFVIDPIDV